MGTTISTVTDNLDPEAVTAAVAAATGVPARNASRSAPNSRAEG